MNRLKLIDIGANLVDEMFQGIYNGTKKHESDLDRVLKRAIDIGLNKIFVTAGNLEEAKAAANLVKQNANFSEQLKLYSTIGVHPTRCGEFETKFESPQVCLNSMKEVFDENKENIVALGEFGLDYDRTNFCDIDTQKKYFQFQLTELGKYTNLPLFLHCRAAAKDLSEILESNKDCCHNGGVIHSFDGTVEEMERFVNMGFHIGINGCSLKTEENCKMVKEIPIKSLMLETDSPWCGIRPSHFSSSFIKTKFESAKKNWTENTMYKQRNEPQTILNVLEVIAGLKNLEPEILADQVYKNTMAVFFKDIPIES